MMTRVKDNRKVLGYALVFVGAFLLLARLGLFSENIFMYLLGGGFIFLYFLFGGKKHYGNIGFLIPGTIIIAIVLFADFFERLGGGLFFIFLAIAFMIVYLHTHKFVLEGWGARNWPIFPAAGLFVFGVFVLIAENNRVILEKVKLLNIFIPVVLIFLGMYFIYNGKNQNRNG